MELQNYLNQITSIITNKISIINKIDKININYVYSVIIVLFYIQYGNI